MVRVAGGVVALEGLRAFGAGELAQSCHAALGLLVGEVGAVPRPVEPVDLGVVAQHPDQVVQGVVHRRRVRLAADEVLGLAHLQVQGRQDLHRARAGGRVPADLGVAGGLVLALVRQVDHGHHLRERALGDALLDCGHGGGDGVEHGEGAGFWASRISPTLPPAED